MLKNAVKQSVCAAIVTQVGDIAARETRFALQQREADLTALIRAAASQAIAEMKEERASKSDSRKFAN